MGVTKLNAQKCRSVVIVGYFVPLPCISKTDFVGSEKLNQIRFSHHHFGLQCQYLQDPYTRCPENEKLSLPLKKNNVSPFAGPFCPRLPGNKNPPLTAGHAPPLQDMIFTLTLWLPSLCESQASLEPNRRSPPEITWS